MSKRERLRRVVLLCCHFARNAAVYRAGWDNGRLIRRGEFWKGINGNCMDMAVLEWCKLFADRRDPHCWSQIVHDSDSFEADLYNALGQNVSAEQFVEYTQHVRRYRDKFIAHLDNEPIAHIPNLDHAISSVFFYHSHVFNTEAELGDLSRLPPDLATFYEQHFNEAKMIYLGQT